MWTPQQITRLAGRRLVGRRILVVIAALAVVGCSATRLVYQRLDWLMAWRLHDYVSLNVAQKSAFKRDFSGLWQWHRSHELPLYARDLREIAAMLDGRPVTAQLVAARSAQFQAHYERLMERTVDGMCGILTTLDDKQAAEILDGVDDDIEKFRKEYVAPSENEQRKNSQKRTAKWIKRWTGPLNGTQEDLLEGWGDQRRSIGAQWLVQRQKWRAQLAEALKQRAASPSCEAMRPLFVTPLAGIDPALARDLAYNENLWNQLIAQVAVTMDDRQLKRASSELRQMAQEFDELAAAR